jgi:hypothetical protein
MDANFRRTQQALLNKFTTNSIRAYLNSRNPDDIDAGITPTSLKTFAKRQRFREAFEQYKIVNNKITYVPLDVDQTPLIVLENNQERDHILRTTYERYPRGQTLFWLQISKSYLGISRKYAIENFLKKQELYQITRPAPLGNLKNPSRTYANHDHVLYLDLIEMAPRYAANNHPYKYIFSAVNGGTKCYLRPIAGKTAAAVRAVLLPILDLIPDVRLVISDNGKEFVAQATVNALRAQKPADYKCTRVRRTLR